MSLPYHDILMATLLALYDLDTSLSEDEKSKLRNIAEQLQIDPNLKQWNTTEEELLEVIDSNSHLKQLFQHYKSCLEQHPTELPVILFPQGDTLKIESRGAKPDDEYSEAKSTEIVNAFMRIAGTPDPAASIKKVNDFAKVKQSVQSAIPKT